MKLVPPGGEEAGRLVPPRVVPSPSTAVKPSMQKVMCIQVIDFISAK
jgi:hypothetical protein